MDPSQTSEINFIQVLSITKDIITIAAAGIGSVIALIGLSTWRRQLRGTVEYDLARRLLSSVFKLRDSINYVRNPVLLDAEIRDAMKKAGVEISEKDKDFDYVSTTLVLANRWKKLTESISEFELEAIEAEVLWDDQIINLLKPLRERLSSLFSASDIYVRSLKRLGKRARETSELLAFERILFKIPENDKYDQELTDAVQGISNYLRKHLKK